MPAPDHRNSSVHNSTAPRASARSTNGSSMPDQVAAVDAVGSILKSTQMFCSSGVTSSARPTMLLWTIPFAGLRIGYDSVWR